MCSPFLEDLASDDSVGCDMSGSQVLDQQVMFFANQFKISIFISLSLNCMLLQQY